MNSRYLYNKAILYKLLELIEKHPGTEESLLKAVRSLEIGVNHIYMSKFDDSNVDELLDYIKLGTDDRIYAIAELIRKKTDLGLINDATKIDMFFLEKIKNIVLMENTLEENKGDIDTLKAAKKMGFGDAYIAKLWGVSEIEIYNLRKQNNIYPVYKMIDTCASEFESYIPYLYSTYEDENESIISNKKKIIVLGSGPIRIFGFTI